MKKYFFLWGWLGVFLLGKAVYGEDVDGSQRYLLYEMRVNNEETPILLDSVKGKVWIFTESSGMTKEKFSLKGVSVEGLAYSLEVAEDLDKLIQEWTRNKLIEKEVRGFSEAMSAEFSYALNFPEIKRMNTQMSKELKRVQQRKEGK